jgi:hypothetical protein
MDNVINGLMGPNLSCSPSPKLLLYTEKLKARETALAAKFIVSNEVNQIQWEPLNGFIDNVINQLMGSNLHLQHIQNLLLTGILFFSRQHSSQALILLSTEVLQTAKNVILVFYNLTYAKLS